MRYLMTFSYDGTNYSGYQKQPKLRTVQGEIESALKRINGGENIEINASGRTDRGVHAINQTAHFDLDKKISIYKLKSALNTYTDKDIYIKDIKLVDKDFHARYMTSRKEYIYKINLGEYNPFDRNYVYQYNKNLNVRIIKKEAKYLVGTHDFSSFANKEEKKESYVRTIYKVKIDNKKDLLTITFVGDGFMKYQVRNMVGALLEVSNGNKKIKDILASRNRNSFGKIAPPEGLYLKKVYYDVEH